MAFTTDNHSSLKCDKCRTCIREGGESRRLGSATVTFWTRVGLWTITLCGDCASVILPALELTGDAVREEP